jgi:hypothetical protein
MTKDGRLISASARPDEPHRSVVSMDRKPLQSDGPQSLIVPLAENAATQATGAKPPVRSKRLNP